MLKNPFSTLKKHEWLLWGISIIVVLISNIIAGEIYLPTLAATLIGVTALIFIAGGNVWGQILTVIFSFLYSITSFKFRYYGEIVTYLGMTMPIAAASVVTWLKNPYKPGATVVKIQKLSFRQKIATVFLTIGVSWIFYYILKYLGNANLLVSTVSVTTSFLASYLMLKRNSWYAVAYAANDIVLIVLWVMAAVEDMAYFPFVICFLMFLINDIYGFISWKLREKKQNL